MDARLRLADAPPIIDRIARIRHLLDPIGKAAQELAIIVRKTGGEVERAVRADRSDRTGGHAQLAFEAGIVVNRVVIVARLTADQHGAQQHEIAKLRVNQVAVNAHVAEPGLDRDGLVRDDPYRPSAGLIHLHGETHGRIDGPDAACFEFGHDCRADLVDLFTGSMEFEVGH